METPPSSIDPRLILHPRPVDNPEHAVDNPGRTIDNPGHAVNPGRTVIRLKRPVLPVVIRKAKRRKSQIRTPIYRPRRKNAGPKVNKTRRGGNILILV
jgi:hypothetical protein